MRRLYRKITCLKATWYYLFLPIFHLVQFYRAARGRHDFGVRGTPYEISEPRSHCSCVFKLLYSL
jgi:hypothetical protein